MAGMLLGRERICHWRWMYCFSSVISGLEVV